MMVGGVVLTSLGGLSLIIAGATANVSIECNYCIDVEPILGFFVGGLVGIAVGVPMLVYGAKRVPAGSTAKALPTWVGSPVARGWAWRF